MSLNHRFSVAPMMDLTDRHARYLLRLISQRTLLYTEMVTADALLYGDAGRLLAYNPEEHPLALQLGGSDPTKLAECCRLARDAGYDEVNLNVGCPSDRVQAGRFGARLMLEPKLVVRCFEAMRNASALPITVKCRIGVDEQNPAVTLPAFLADLQNAGCKTIIIHARKAWLKGLSPKENREIPPLDYELVHAMKVQFPKLNVVINGGIRSVAQTLIQLERVDGVMMGRKAYYEPYTLQAIDHKVFGDSHKPTSRQEIFGHYLQYIERELSQGTPLKQMSRHALGLFHGEPGARAFRRHISELAYRPGAGLQVMKEAARLLH